MSDAAHHWIDGARLATGPEVVTTAVCTGADHGRLHGPEGLADFMQTKHIHAEFGRPGGT